MRESSRPGNIRLSAYVPKRRRPASNRSILGQSPNFGLEAGSAWDHNSAGTGVRPMIEVIVNVRDAVFAALVAWTGVGDAEPPKPQKDQISRGQPAAAEKPVQQQAPKVY